MRVELPRLGRRIGLLILVATLLNGCVDEYTGTARLNLTSIVNGPKTRSTNQSIQLTQFDAGESVGVYLDNVDASIPKQYTTGGGGVLTPANGVQPSFPVSGSGLYLTSIYPYQPSATYGAQNTFAVQTDQSTDANYKKSDLMWGVPTPNPVARTANAVPINYQHLLSRININLSVGVGTPDLTNAVVKINGTRIATTFSPKSGAITPATGNASPITAFTAGSTLASQKGSVIIVPQTVYKGTDLIEVVLANGISLSYVLNADLTFSQKTEYTFNVTVNNASLDVQSSIMNWGTSSAIQADGFEYLTPTPNCFIVKTGGTVTIPVTNVNIFWGKHGDGAIATSMGNTAREPNLTDLNFEVAANLIKDTKYVVEVVWSDFDVKNKKVIDFTNKTINSFDVSGFDTEGNLVVAIRQGPNSDILWSWHIWVTNANLEANTVTLPSGLVAMDRNLGAISSTPGDPNTLGLLYQWGRKDPFPSSSDITKPVESITYDAGGRAISFSQSGSGSLLLSVNNPFTFYTSGGDPFTSGHLSGTFGYNRWGGSESNTVANPIKNKRSLYDPCPAGWRIPWGQFWKNMSGVWNGTLSGMTIAGNFYPASAYRLGDTGALNSNSAKKGGYWSSSFVERYTPKLTPLFIYSWGIQTGEQNDKTDAYSIRPVRE